MPAASAISAIVTSAPPFRRTSARPASRMRRLALDMLSSAGRELLDMVSSLAGQEAKPRTLRSMGAVIDLRVRAEDSGAAYSLIEMTVPPRFPGAPKHFHKQMTERFIALEG